MSIFSSLSGKLQACNLGCIRGERKVFSGINFTLNPGESLIISGPNGSGKSSLLRILSGLLKPSKGELLWQGESVFQNIEGYRPLLNFVGHSDCIKPSMTVSEHLIFWSKLRGDQSSVEEALEKTDLLNLAQTPGRFLSAGQKKRVSLARLLTSGAPLWFLDEPTVTLDSESEKILENLILKHRSCEGIVVVATHSNFKIDKAHKLNMGSHIMSGSNLTQSKLTSYQDKNSAENWQEW